MIPNSFLEKVLYSTVHIKLLDKDSKPNGTGTGFLVGVNLENNGFSIVLLISNKHVFHNSPKFIVNFHKRKSGLLEPDLGNVFPHLTLEYEGVYSEHPNPEVDLACINISNILDKYKSDLYYQVLDQSVFSDFSESYLDIANRIIFVGYPEGLFDPKHNLPIIRTGTIASHPKIDFNDEPQFLIDAQVFLGSSGSPVFVNVKEALFNKEDFRYSKNIDSHKLIGVVSATMIKNNIIKHIETKTIDIAQEVIGLGIVFKTTALKELINEAIKNLDSSLRSE